MPLPSGTVTSTTHEFTDGFYATHNRNRVLRVLPDGTLDPTFGNEGVAPLLLPTYPAASGFIFSKQFVLPDGRLILGGTLTQNGGVRKGFVLMQYALNGAGDASFGNGGLVTVQTSGAMTMSLADFEVLPNGHIVAVGSARSSTTGDYEAVIARLLPSGAPDEGAVGGWLTVTSFGSTSSDVIVGDLAVGPDGSQYLISSTQGQQAIRKYNLDGSTDLTFGAGGVATQPSNIGSGTLLVSPQGKLVQCWQVSGSGLPPGNHDIVLSQFDLATGALDTTLDNAGVVTLVDLPPTGGPTLGARPQPAFDSKGNLVVAYGVEGGMNFASFTHDGVPFSVVGDPADNVLLDMGYDCEPALLPLRNGEFVATLTANSNTAFVYGFAAARLNVHSQPAFLRRELQRELHVTSGSAGSVIEIRREGTDLKVTIDGTVFTESLIGIELVSVANGEGSDTISLGDCAGLTIRVDAGPGDDVIELGGSAVAIAVDIRGGNGSDEVRVSSAMQIDALSIAEVVSGAGSSTDILTVIDEGHNDFTLTAQLTWGSKKVSFADIDRLRLLTGDGDDHVLLNPPYDVHRDLLVEIHAGDGNDHVQTSWAAGSIPTVFGGDGDDIVESIGSSKPISMVGGAGEDHLLISGSGERVVGMKGVRLGGVYVMPLETERIRYESPGSATDLRISDGGDQLSSLYLLRPDGVMVGSLPAIDLAGIAGISVDGGYGNDTIISSISPELHPLNIRHSTDDNDELILDYRQYKQGYTYTESLNGLSINGVIHGVTSETVRILAGPGEDSFNIAPNTTIAWVIDGGNPSPGDTLRVRIGGAASPLLTQTTPESGLFTSDRKPIEFTNISDAALLDPVMSVPTFAYWSYSVVVGVETRIVPALADLSLVQLQNLTTGRIYSGSELAITSIATSSGSITTYSLSIRLASSGPGSSTVLENGNYKAFIPGAAIRDYAGNAFGNDISLDFYSLTGDFNRDRNVNFGDLLTLAQNYGRLFSSANGLAHSKGDITGDGWVNFSDMLILAQVYGTYLAPASPAVAISPLRKRQALNELA